jgi:hypothetical protein
LALATSLTAFADFSYTTTTKSSGGGPMAAAMNRTGHHYLKGQKMKIDNGDSSIIMDFDAQTMTTINNAQKTYSVLKFSDLGDVMKSVGASDVKIDVKETGQKKDVNGYPAREIIMTMAVSMDTGRGSPMQMQMEMDMWVSSAVPGVSELKTFYQRNGAKMPWSAMAGGGGNQSMQKAVAEIQRKMSSLEGVPVQQTMKVSMPGMGLTPAQQAQMAQAQAQLEAMKKQNPEAAKMMEKAMAGRMGGGGGGMGGIEVTTDSSEFSTKAVPDSVFAIPAGYTQSQK